MTNAADGPRAALVRPPSDAFAQAISSGGAVIDPDRARAQHAAYRAALADLVEVVVLPADQELPDACFVDDCAIGLGKKIEACLPDRTPRARRRCRAYGSSSPARSAEPPAPPPPRGRPSPSAWPRSWPGWWTSSTP